MERERVKRPRRPPEIEVEPIPELKALKFTALPPLPEISEDHCLNPHLRLSWIARRTWEIMRMGLEARKAIPWKLGIRQAWSELELICMRRFGVRIRG